jgi:hypothetical protein
MHAELHPLPLLGRPESPTPPSIEQIIGELVATAATLVAQGLGQFKHEGRMGADTKHYGGETIALLYEIRQGTIGELDFDTVARVQGVRVLQERSGATIKPETISSLVDAAIYILNGVVRLRLN